MSTIIINHNVNSDTKVPERTITLDCPEVLEKDSLADLAEILGEDFCVNEIKAQLKIKFRALIRGMLASMTDGEYTNTDEDIKALDFSDWKPEVRVRMTAQEKAMKALGSLPPEERAAIFAALEADTAE